MLPAEQCRCVLAGVEVWLLAQSAVGIWAGVPASAEMVCKGLEPQEPRDMDMTVRLAALRSLPALRDRDWLQTPPYTLKCPF
jgi:hypothetical protein